MLAVSSREEVGTGAGCQWNDELHFQDFQAFYVHPSNLSGYTVSVNKLGVLLVLSPTFPSITLPFAHNNSLNDVF